MLPDFSTMQIEIDNGKVIKCCIGDVVGATPGSGNRCVFLFPDLGIVVKFDHRKKEWGDFFGVQNLREVKNFAKIAEEDKDYFAKILHVGKLGTRKYVVQEYCPHDGVELEGEVKTKFQEVLRKYRITDVQVWYRHNFVITNGQPKIYDLGWEKF